MDISYQAILIKYLAWLYKGTEESQSGANGGSNQIVNIETPFIYSQ